MEDPIDMVRKEKKEEDVIISIQASNQDLQNTYGQVFPIIKEPYLE